ncbi:MAG: serine/threonine-protein phosphatase, partial [Catenulispora sp.]|nr:serine/threonine-protein phosphatase [Catenulispora sp.]
HLVGESFVTAILAEVSEHEIALLNCGHPPPLVLRGNGEACAARPKEEGLPLGLGPLGPPRPEPDRVRFEEGDRLLFYTDGVIEARDRAGTFYPLEERTYMLDGDPDPQAALDTLRADLLDHVGGPLLDDAAMLLLVRRRG